MPPKKKPSGQIALDRAAVAAQILLANYRDIVKDDDAAKLDLIEGETDFLESVDIVLEDLDETESYVNALSERIKTLTTRKSRLESRAAATRGAIMAALQGAQLDESLRRPEATLTLSVGPKTLEIDTKKEADIPSAYWITQPPKLDKKLLLKALKELEDGEEIPGAELVDGKAKLTIRRS